MARYTDNEWSYGFLLNKLGGREETQLAHNTRVYRTEDDDGSKVCNVVYHSTCIAVVRFNQASLWTGGYHTSTTKTRLNLISLPMGYRIYQQNFNWFIVKVGDWDNPKPFEEGVILYGPNYSITADKGIYA